MPFIAWIITLIFTTENVLPYLIGLSHTPKDAVFLGTVHHPSDYFYYVSQIAQGTTRWITAIDLYTSESIKPTLIGWSNVLIGNLLIPLGASPMLAYQIAIVILTITLFLAAYLLAKEVFGDNKRLATISLYLFGLYHAFPIVRDGLPSYGDYFNNFAVPRVRYGAVPHQLLLATVSIFLTFLILQWSKTKKNHSIKQLLLITVSSIILSSLQPALWATIIGTFSLSAIIFRLSHRDTKDILNTFIIPIFIAIIAGILPTLYLSNLFQTLPFIQLKSWEVTQHTTFTFHHFISATGPIFLIAIATMPWFLKKYTYSKIYISLFAIISLSVFLSPIPTILGLSHVRFMSTLVVLCLSIIATAGIEKFSESCLMYLRSVFSITRLVHPQHIHLIILTILTIYLLPNHLITIRLASEFSPTNAYHYIARSEYEFLQKSARVSSSDDTFLVIWPYNVMFPAISGRRSFHGHSLLTINSTQKDALATQFFDNKMSEEQARIFLQEHHISHVLAYSWTTLPKGFMIHKATSGSLSLFEVNQEYLKTYSK